MRLIDADKEIQGLRRVINAHQNGNDNELLTNRIFENFIKFLMKAPTVEAKPIRHAHWIPKRLGNCECSNCYGEYGVCGGLLGDYNYCPNCSAKMDKEIK